jgi:CSLREA domain-containing protein
LVLCTDAASAATITVTTGGDTVGTASTCTLRQAIASANNDNAGASNCVTGSGADTIQFAAALADSTITLAQGQLSISTPVTITGSNQTIDANYQSRIFQIDSVVTASNLTLRHGYSSGAQGYSGGAINAFNSTLSLSDVVIDHNKTASYGGGLQVYHTTLDMTVLHRRRHQHQRQFHGNDDAREDHRQCSQEWRSDLHERLDFRNRDRLHDQWKHGERLRQRARHRQLRHRVVHRHDHLRQ